MKINYLRASGINQYKSCAFKYFLLNVVGLSDVTNFRALLGTCIHRIAEVLAKAKLTGHHDKFCDKYSDPEYLIKICIARYKRTNPEFVWAKKDEKFVRDAVYWILNSKFNPLNLDIIKTEQQFELEIRKPGFQYSYINDLTGQLEEGFCKLRGTMDLVLREFDVLNCQDYKSGKNLVFGSSTPKTYEDFTKDIQLRVYDVALKTIYPQDDFRVFTLIYTSDGGPFSVAFGPKEYADTIAELRRIYRTILFDNNPSRLKDDPARRYNQSWVCKYVCKFGPKYSNTCDQYYSILKKEGIEKATKTIYQLGVDPALKEKLSQRNDYTRSKIFKGTIE